MDIVIKAEAVMMTVASEAASVTASVVINMVASEATRKRAGDNRFAFLFYSIGRVPLVGELSFEGWGE